MAVSAKSYSLAAELAEDLGRRFSNVTLTQDSTSGFEGCPLVKFGTGAAGSQSACIRSKQVDPIVYNSIGQLDQGFATHVAQVVLETSTIANTPLLTGINQATLFLVLGFRALKTELYMSANTNAVGPEDIISGNLKGTVDENLKWKGKVSQ